jgi:hypothetical protein
MTLSNGHVLELKIGLLVSSIARPPEPPNKTRLDGVILSSVCCCVFQYSIVGFTTTERSGGVRLAFGLLEEQWLKWPRVTMGSDDIAWVAKAANSR